MCYRDVSPFLVYTRRQEELDGLNMFGFKVSLVFTYVFAPVRRHEYLPRWLGQAVSIPIPSSLASIGHSYNGLKSKAQSEVIISVTAVLPLSPAIVGASIGVPCA